LKSIDVDNTEYIANYKYLFL